MSLRSDIEGLREEIDELVERVTELEDAATAPEDEHDDTTPEEDADEEEEDIAEQIEAMKRGNSSWKNEFDRRLLEASRIFEQRCNTLETALVSRFEARLGRVEASTPVTRLDGQLKRIEELESRLNELARRSGPAETDTVSSKMLRELVMAAREAEDCLTDSTSYEAGERLVRALKYFDYIK